MLLVGWLALSSVPLRTRVTADSGNFRTAHSNPQDPKAAA